MIEKMKKITFFLHSDDRNDFLSKLQHLGVIHLETTKDLQKLEILVVKEKLTKLRKSYQFLTALASEEKVRFEQEKFHGEMNVLIDEIDKTKVAIDEATVKLEKVKTELNELAPWGSYNADQIASLTKMGLKLRYFIASVDQFASINTTEVPFEKVGAVDNNIYYVVVQSASENFQDLPGKEAFLPAVGSNELKVQLEKAKLTLDHNKNKMLGFTKHIKNIENNILSLEDRLAYTVANNSLNYELEGKILVTSGWFPAASEKDVLALLETRDVAYLLEEPTVEDRPPIKLRNNRFSRLFEPITKVYSLPNYHEIDTTVFLAPFFALFVGLCLADIGYGVLMLAATVPAYFILKGEMKKLAALGIVLSIMTIFGGVILGDIFGIETENGLYPSFLKPLAIFPNMQEAMKVPILLGFIQVFLGHILRTYNGFRNYGIAGALKPIGTALLVVVVGFGLLELGFFGDGAHLKVGPIPVGPWIYSIPNLGTVTSAMLVIGLVLVLLFNGVEHNLKFYLRPPMGIWELYEFFSAIVGDILSYLRLFALGLAGGLLGSSFNTIGLIVRGDGSNIILWVLMIVVLLLGHGINLALALIAAFVHPVRLTFVEFYKAIGFKGGGVQYTPFKLKYKAVKI